MKELMAFEVDYRVHGDPELKQSLVKVDVGLGQDISSGVAAQLRCAHGTQVQISKIWVPPARPRA